METIVGILVVMGPIMLICYIMAQRRERILEQEWQKQKWLPKKTWFEHEYGRR